MRQTAQAISGSSWSTFDGTNQYYGSEYLEDGDGAQAAASAGSQYCSGRGDFGDSPRGKYNDENEDQAVPEGWKHATQKELEYCWTAACSILDTLTSYGDPAYKWKGKRKEWWPPFAKWSASGCAVIRFCTILTKVGADDRKAACLWCDKMPESISNADYAKVVDNLIKDCCGMNEEENTQSEPIKLVMAASVDTKAELAKSALAVAAFAHNVITHKPNNSAADWEAGTYFKGDRPD